MENSRGLPANLEVPSALQVIPLSPTAEPERKDRLKVTSPDLALAAQLWMRRIIYANQFQVRTTEQLLTEMARLQGPPPELDIELGSVYARTQILRGTRYGPFLGKWTNEPIDKRFAWEVSGLCFFFLFLIINLSIFFNSYYSLNFLLSIAVHLVK